MRPGSTWQSFVDYFIHQRVHRATTTPARCSTYLYKDIRGANTRCVSGISTPPVTTIRPPDRLMPHGILRYRTRLWYYHADQRRRTLWSGSSTAISSCGRAISATSISSTTSMRPSPIWATPWRSKLRGVGLYLLNAYRPLTAGRDGIPDSYRRGCGAAQGIPVSSGVTGWMNTSTRCSSTATRPGTKRMNH